MSFEIDQQEVANRKKETRMQWVCSIIAMVLMVAIIIILIVASSVDTDVSVPDKPWSWISAAVLGGLLLIDIVVFIILKVKFKKQRSVKEIKTEQGETNNE